MKKKIFKSLIFIYTIFVLTATAFFISWKIDLWSHKYMTKWHGYKFESYEIHKTPDKINSLVVLDYSFCNARVYYYFDGESGSKVIDYQKINGKWEIKDTIDIVTTQY